MDKWEFKVLHVLSEEELNKWGEEGYEIDNIIQPPASTARNFPGTTD